LLQLDLVV